MRHTVFTSAPGDGLNEVVHGALDAVSADNQDPIGILELASEPADATDPGGATVCVESAFGLREGRQVFEVLGARVRCRPPEPAAERELVRRGLQLFGGQRYTSVSGTDPSAGRQGDGFDATVYFPSGIPFYATNICLVEADLTDREGRALQDVLGALGARRTGPADRPRVGRHQLRAPMTAAAQLAAYEAARAAGVCVALYASGVPAVQSVRIQRDPSEASDARLDVFVGRGLSAARFCTSADAREITSFLLTHLGVHFGGRTWEVENCHGQGDEEPSPSRGLAFARAARRRYT